MSTIYHVGIYCRLSVDDASNSAKANHYIPADESTSIENQRDLLSKFAMLNGWVEIVTMAIPVATSSGPDFWKCWKMHGRALSI